MSEELKVIISAQITKYKKSVRDAQKQITDFKKKIKDAAKKVKDDMDKIGEAVTNAAKKIAVGVGAAITALLALAASTTEARENQAKLATAFQLAGGSAEQAQETYNSLYRVLGDGGQATEAAQHLAKLTTEEQALTEWTTICQGVYATFGESLPIEALAEAANETAKTGELTGALADALNWAGIAEEEFQKKLDACNTEAEREALIRETLNGQYAQAAALYETNNAAVLAQRDAQAELQTQLNLLGEAMAPVNTAFTTFGSDCLALITPILQDLAEKILPWLKEKLDAIKDWLEDAIVWMTEHKDLLSVIVTIILAVVAAIIIMNTVMTITNGIMTLLSMNPITIAIIALIAAIILCIVYWDEIKAVAVKAWEWIKEKWGQAKEWFSNLWESIKEKFANVKEWFKEKFGGAWDAIKEKWGGVKTWFSEKWEGIKNIFANVKGWFKEKFSAAWEAIKGVFGGIKGWFQQKWNDITSVFSNAGSKIGGAIKGAVNTAINAVLSTGVNIINGFIGAINGAIGIINMIPGVSIGYLQKLSYTPMARGGVVDSATFAMIGEAGTEAVVPLENNLGWLNKLAGMLNERMGGGGASKIVLTVDGKALAEASIESINQLTRQTGTLGLNLV